VRLASDFVILAHPFALSPSRPQPIASLARAIFRRPALRFLLRLLLPTQIVNLSHSVAQLPNSSSHPNPASLLLEARHFFSAVSLRVRNNATSLRDGQVKTNGLFASLYTRLHASLPNILATKLVCTQEFSIVRFPMPRTQRVKNTKTFFAINQMRVGPHLVQRASTISIASKVYIRQSRSIHLTIAYNILNLAGFKFKDPLTESRQPRSMFH
jgi:hypothetical protein